MPRIALSVYLLLVAAPPAAAQARRVVPVDQPPEWGDSVRLVEELRIGTIDGDQNYAFGQIGGVAVTPDGTIWVGDRQLSAIRRYTSDGAYLDQIGRAGEGPGEFKYPFGMRVLPDSSVVVWDDGQIRVSRFDQDGTFLDSFAPPAHMIGSSMEELEVDAAGNLYLLTTNILSLTPEQSQNPSRVRVGWLRMTRNGDILDTVAIPPSDSEGTVDRLATLSALSPLGYLVTGRNDEYALDLHVSSERVVRLERRWQPVGYQRAERAEKQRLEDVYVSRSGRPRRRIPNEKPVFSHFEVDVEGRIWVQVAVPGFRDPESPGEEASRRRACEFFAATPAECDEGVREWRDPVVYEVFAPEGRFLGRISFPNRQTDIFVTRGPLLWAVELGSFGEAFVVRYRIVPGR